MKEKETKQNKVEKPRAINDFVLGNTIGRCIHIWLNSDKHIHLILTLCEYGKLSYDMADQSYRLFVSPHYNAKDVVNYLLAKGATMK